MIKVTIIIINLIYSKFNIYYLTLHFKFFDGIMLIFITATTITILLFLIFLYK